eukprot:gnl/MRDRNA2_/MRDRNA2_542911_c0_seq1.p1 gnl/MRDRNA2_/MRDRNA2_542911_c0~~gnl/MRDRNA2_/MRDRNA2_542911_c0_seq1.p1  ORF type:complete len:135 (-),score=12.42 gnl/MRDRNA2_/MRDRNA2_542911_c0_seq1:6-410(-)
MSPELLAVLKSQGHCNHMNTLSNCMRVYRYKKDFDRSQTDTSYHFDVGLLSMIPRGTRPALLVKPPNPVYIEELMGEDEAVLMGGMTLARLTGIHALEHGVCTHSKTRFSAPFFQRLAPSCVLPATPGRCQIQS